VKNVRKKKVVVKKVFEVYNKNIKADNDVHA